MKRNGHGPFLQEVVVARERIRSGVAIAASIVLTAAGIVCLFAFAYFFYYYPWSGQRQLTSWTGMLLYCVAPALLAALFFASLRLSASSRINLSIGLCSAAFSIAAFELALSVWFNLPSVLEEQYRQVLSEAAQEEGAAFDTRRAINVIHDLREQGIDAGPSIYPQELLLTTSDGTVKSAVSLDGVEVLPLASISRRTTVVCNEAGEFLVHETDEHGFNNPPGLWGSGETDVVAVGDSFVQGFCVPPDRTFIAEIRKRYPKTLSLGMGGNGPLVMLASIKEYAEILRPKVLLWFYFEGNDLADLETEKKNALLLRYLNDDFRQGLQQRQAEIDRALGNYVEPLIRKTELRRKLEEVAGLVRGFEFQPNAIVARIKLSQLRTRLGLIMAESSQPAAVAGAVGADTMVYGKTRSVWAKEQLTLFRDILLEAKRSTEQWGGRLYFIYLPAWTAYAPVDGGLNPERDGVLDSVMTAGIPVIDIHEVFQAHPDPLSLFPFRRAHHYNEEGQRLVAQRTLEAISFD
jgi:hypothetical protein